MHRDDVYMPITPMFHVHAWGLPYVATMMAMKQVDPGRYTPEGLLGMIERENVTFSHCVPTISCCTSGSATDAPTGRPCCYSTGSCSASSSGFTSSRLAPMPRFSTLASIADKLMRRLGHTGQMDVLGVSWGGALAQQFAHQFPARCRRLVLASTSPGAIRVPGKLSVLMKLMMPRRYTDPDYLHEIGGEIYGGVYRRDPALLKEHSRHMRSPGGRGYLYQLIATWGWTSLPWRHSLRQPTLVMHANDDPIVPLINARILVASIPNAELHVVNDGHLLLVTQAREAAPVLERFLAQDAP